MESELSESLFFGGRRGSASPWTALRLGGSLGACASSGFLRGSFETGPAVQEPTVRWESPEMTENVQGLSST